MPTAPLRLAFRAFVVVNRTVLTTLLCLNIVAAGALWVMPDSGQAIMSMTSSIFVAFFLYFVPVIGFCVAVFLVGGVFRGTSWALPGSLVLWTLLSVGMLGLRSGVQTIVIAAAIGALAGLTFWFLLGRVRRSSDVGGPDFLASQRSEKLISTAFVVFGLLFLGTALIGRVENMVFTEDRANPAFQDEFFRPLSSAELKATRRFTTVETCADAGKADQAVPDIDWSRIRNSNEAKICIFRILQLTNDIEQAADWLVLQGLRVSRDTADGTLTIFNKGRDGDFRISAGRTVRRSEGDTYIYTPLYHAKTPLGQVFSLMAYGMSFEVYYRADETKPYSVSVSASTV